MRGLGPEPVTRGRRFRAVDDVRSKMIPPLPPLIRISFESRRGRAIVREVEPGSVNADKIVARLLRRKNAFRISGLL